MPVGFSLRGLLVALGIAALGLPAAIAGLFDVVTQLDDANTNVAGIREGQLNVADLQRIQSDEENAARAYAATADRSYAKMYRTATLEFPVRVKAIAARLGFGSEDERATAALDDAVRLNARWRQRVAEPAIDHTRGRTDDRQASATVRHVRDDIDIISAVLIGDYHRLFVHRAAIITRATWIALAALIVVALQIVVYAFLATRLRGELARVRRVVAVLQSAMGSEAVNDERIDAAASYVSATRGAKVGGDVYDIFPLDANRTLVVIADVSGKGVGAAVDSTFVKFGLRTLASEFGDIAAVVTKFNRLYERALRRPETFVVLFTGILDHRLAQLTYVNAGHEAAYIRRGRSIDVLAPTGPIVGVIEDARFVAAVAPLGEDDMLFLSTDGLTEARTVGGTFLGGAGVERWLEEADVSSAQALINNVAQRLRRYTRDRNADDLAIVAVRLKLTRMPDSE